MNKAGSTDRKNLARIWLMLAAGTLVAAAEVWAVAPHLHQPSRREWLASAMWSLFSVVFALSGGAIAAWVTGFAISAKRADALAIIRGGAVGWAFLPVLTVLALRRSWLLFPLAALSAVATAFRLRPLFRTVTDSAMPPLPASSLMQTLSGLPPMGMPPLRTFFVALSLQASAIFAIVGKLALSAGALALCLAMLIAWWTPADGAATRGLSGDRRAVQLAMFAFALLLLALTPWIAGTGGLGVSAARSKGGGSPNHPATPRTNQAGVDYVGVILYPPPKKKLDIVPPRPGIGTRTLIIPFDGPYWYFKAPMTGPGAHAHITFGKSTEANVRSTDWMPLRMEAHMNLGTPIDLDCCREINVTVTNADNRAGRIDLALVLSNTESPASRPITLGDAPVLSSETVRPTAHDRAPITETLHFTVPRATPIHQFDEINVILQPSAERSRIGSKIAIVQFELVPR
jgi:hypothetical protein